MVKAVATLSDGTKIERDYHVPSRHGNDIRTDALNDILFYADYTARDQWAEVVSVTLTFKETN